MSGPAGTARTYVLDTSVVLSDPACWRGFAEHHVVLPLTVVTELEGKRHHAELGWTARQALRALEELRIAHGSLTEPIVANDEGGTVRVEMNHRDLEALPPGLRAGGADVTILAVARNLADEGHEVVLVSKDLPLRLKASVAGVAAEEYRRQQATAAGWTGVERVTVTKADLDRLYADHVLTLPPSDHGDGLPVHTGVVLTDGYGASALGRVHPDKQVHLVQVAEAFGVRGRSAEQRLALDLLLDAEVPVVSLGGAAGTGKTMLALAAGLEAVVERRTHRKVVVFRPLYAVGGQELGYLPGSQDEKMEPWAGAVYDALEAFCSPEVLDEVKARGYLEVLPLTHIRGRSLTGSFVIFDEAQNHEAHTVLAALSRLGEGSRAVLCWDVAQRDNPYVGRHDGVVSVVEGLTGHPLFGHISLVRSERSAVAGLASRLLEETLAL